MTFSDIKIGSLFRTSTDRDTPLFMKCTDRVDIFAISLHDRNMYDMLSTQVIYLEANQKLDANAFENDVFVKDM